MQVREREGVDAVDGIDTLLIYLLAELEDVPRLVSFADGPQQVTPQVVAGLLQRKGRSDTLAQLYAGAGQAAAGLALWKVPFPPLLCPVPLCACGDSNIANDNIGREDGTVSIVL